VLVGAAAAYSYGRSSKDLGAAREVGRAAGFTAGVQRGRAATETKYSPGAAAYRAIYRKGRSAGERSGYKLGEGVGRDLGQSQGEQQGENNAFEGYPGGWEVGRWYIIKIASGNDVGSKARYSIPTRVGPMEYSQTYDLCDTGGGICGTG
jgi:hypothetical protein